MKSFTVSALLALAGTTLAAPVDICSMFPRYCPSSTTTSPTSPTVAVPTVISPPTVSTTSTPASVSVPAASTKASTAVPAASASAQGNCTPQSAPANSNTENGIASSNCCAPLTVIYARGTSEQGNVGSVAGPPMFKSLRAKLGAGKVLVQGVEYPADAAGNSKLGASGGPALASSIKTILARCPNTKIIASGYSQGGMVVHNAFSAQGITSAQVAGAVIFGDPLMKQKVGDLSTDRVKEFCASGDSVCENGNGVITAAHTTYGKNADEAASWIISLTGVA